MNVLETIPYKFETADEKYLQKQFLQNYTKLYTINKTRQKPQNFMYLHNYTKQNSTTL
jgi:hypothetical protein